MRKRFCAHLYPVRTFRGDPTRPAYTLYSLHDYPTYLAAMNELDELIDQWPRNRPRTVALLGVRKAFFDNGATHWEVGMVYDEDQENVHGLMLNERRWPYLFNNTLRCYQQALGTVLAPPGNQMANLPQQTGTGVELPPPAHKPGNHATLVY